MEDRALRWVDGLSCFRDLQTSVLDPLFFLHPQSAILHPQFLSPPRGRALWSAARSSASPEFQWLGLEREEKGHPPSGFVANRPEPRKMEDGGWRMEDRAVRRL